MYIYLQGVRLCIKSTSGTAKIRLGKVESKEVNQYFSQRKRFIFTDPQGAHDAHSPFH